MNRITTVFLAAACLLGSQAIGQENRGVAVDLPGSKTPPGQSVKKRVSNQASTKRAFEGVVVRVDVPSGTLSVGNKGGVVTFDVSSPRLSGYKSLSEIRPGNKVALSYTEDGVNVKRLGAKETTPPKAEEPRVLTPPKSPKAEQKQSTPAKLPQTTKTPKLTKRLQKRPPNGEGGFDDADVNRDGKITPVELSVAIPDITMERFRKYDKNGNGCLDKAEFSEAIRQEKANGNK